MVDHVPLFTAAPIRRDNEFITLIATSVAASYQYSMDFDCLTLLLFADRQALQKKLISHIRQSQAKRRIKRKRMSFHKFKDYLSDRQFRRMFRMPKKCFEELCYSIREKVGEDEFKTEENLHSTSSTLSGNKRKIFRAHEESTGGFICGEVKLALSLRVLSGGAYQDLALIYGVGETYTYEIFHDVMENWICHPDFENSNVIDLLEDEDAMKAIAREFAAGTTKGVIGGCIGAIDGWLVRISKPVGVPNASNFLSRKGYFAINVQAICDKKKRFLWKSILCRGGEHDASAFAETDLFTYLENNADRLLRSKFYFVGDSAYSLRSYLLCPYDSAMSGSDEDAFNFHQSSCRIYIECAFGEMNLRWGLFWRAMKYGIQRNTIAIDAAMRLHNFIVNYRERNNCVDSPDKDLNVYDDECMDFMTANPDEIIGTYSGEILEQNVRRQPMGRPSKLRKMGKEWRDKLRNRIVQEGLGRPPCTWKRTATNNIRITG